MNWKEQFRQTFWLPESRKPEKIRDFISTEIIEKLIAESSQMAHQCEIGQIDCKALEQQLRDRWL